MPLEAALDRARTEGLDLVEISPMASPPVCKIMDYGKFKYEEKKKASEAKRAQVTVLLKEVKLRPKTEEHDYEFKVRNTAGSSRTGTRRRSSSSSAGVKSRTGSRERPSSTTWPRT